MAYVFESPHSNAATSSFNDIPVPPDGERVIACRWQGRDAFAKRTSRQRALEVLMLSLFGTLVRRYLGAPRRFIPARRRATPAFEVQRLAELIEAGAWVPRVLAANDAVFVVESVGRPLDKVLAEMPVGEARLRLITAAAIDLASFHKAGHWHGNAQVRNVAVSESGFARFDFDRDCDRHLPLEQIQALDVVLFLASLADLGDADAVETAARCYLASAPEDVLVPLQRCRRVVRWLKDLRSLQWLAPKEISRLCAVYLALAGL
jgi:tRNA A-37 threonylcarbamoyl transferase component Bud32